MTTYKNITVYCGSHFGNDGAFVNAASRIRRDEGHGFDILIQVVVQFLEELEFAA